MSDEAATPEEGEEAEAPVVPAGYIPDTKVGGQSVVDGEIVTFDAEGNEVSGGEEEAEA